MRRLPVPTGLLAAALLTTAAATATPASAERARCVPGSSSSPMCTWRTGKVTFVDDGDTINVSPRPIARSPKIRITGMQAMELTRYSGTASRRRGECHGVPAANRLEQLLKASGNRVRYAAQRTSSISEGRARRAVYIKRAGRWVNVAKLMLAEGHALWLPNEIEYAWNRDLGLVADKAALTKRNIWDDDTCGAGPSAGAPLELVVNWDADLGDNENLNDEWVRIANGGGSPVSLTGWWLRDSALRRFRFPNGASIPAGGFVKLHVGSGTTTKTDFYWRQPAAAFENITTDAKALGDGAYLFDPNGDLRAHMQYPCRVACPDPAEGALVVAAEYRSDESIRVRNAGATPVDLGRYRVENPPYGYTFAPGTTLGSDETMTIDVGGDPADDTRLRRHWGFDRTILDNPGDLVQIATYRGVRVACTAWGSVSCG